MKLYFNPASPYVRKVRVTAYELGLSERIELISISLTPVNPHQALRSSNPIGKTPTLITDDGASYDSPVICEYLDSLAGGHRIFPATGAARWTALRRQALADAVMDAAVLTRYEEAARPKELRWQDWIDGQLLKVRTILDALERETSMRLSISARSRSPVHWAISICASRTKAGGSLGRGSPHGRPP